MYDAVRRIYVPEVVLFAQYHVGLRVKRGPDLAQSAATASAHQTILVPKQVQRLQQKPTRTYRTRPVVSSATSTRA